MLNMNMKSLVFSDFHGCNVIIRDNGTLCEGRYIKAHGQYITQTPMKIGQSFVLEFCGTGIVKFNTFARKCQAEDWVRSGQPLAKGCKRIRIKGRLLYAVSIPKPGRCVLVESIPNNGKSRFTLEAGPEATLAFDIECGDVVVSLLNTGLAQMYDCVPLMFDSFCHSPQVKITTSEEKSSATLLHYNPSSLCCLDDTPLVLGAVFTLEVDHAGSSNTGSYIRICVARRVELRAYENNAEDKCWGTTIKPCYQGKRLILSGESNEIFTEVFTIQVLKTSLVISSWTYGKVLDRISFPEAADNTLWFELHRVSARIYENDKPHAAYHDAAAAEHDFEGVPSSLFLLPPPPPPPPQPPPLSRPACRQRKTKRAAHSRHCSPSNPGGICSRGYLSETSSSDAHDRAPPVCGRNNGTHISTPSLHRPRYINSMPCSHTPGWYIPSKNRTMHHDRLCETDVDMSRCITCGTNLVSLVSVESSEEPHSQRVAPNQNVPHSHYEKPDPVWLKPKHKCAAFQHENRGPNSYHLKEGNDKCMHTRKLIRTCQIFPDGLESSNPIPGWDANLNSGSLHSITQGTLTQHSGELQDSVPDKQTQDKYRQKMCERWVKCVNSSRFCWLSQESDIEEEQLSNEQYRRRAFQHSRDPVSPERIKSRQSNGSAIPTSSVWIPETLGYESVVHNLDIEIVPAQGHFRAHSYDSTSFASNSPVPFQHSTNSGPDNDNQEMTLKKLYYEPTEASAENVSTWSDDSETCTKSVDSGGFDVGRKDDRGASCWTSDASDRVPCMKLRGQEQNRNLVFNPSILHNTPTNVTDFEKNLPKPCRYQPWSELVSSRSPPLSHMTTEEQKSFIYDSNCNKFLNENETEDSSTVDEDGDDESCGEVNEASQDAMTLTSNNESEKENELNERAIDSDSGVVSLRIHNKNPRRNIVDSNISNRSHTSAASSEEVMCLSLGPTVKLPTQDECNNSTDPAFKRTDTLKRNLDTSPRPSLRKTCSTKTKSLDFDQENETESIGSKPFAEFCTNITALYK